MYNIEKLIENIRLTVNHNIFIGVNTHEQLNQMEEIVNLLDEELPGKSKGITFNDYRVVSEYQRQRGLTNYYLPTVIFFNPLTSSCLLNHQGIDKDGNWVEGYEELYNKSISLDMFINLEKHPECLI